MRNFEALEKALENADDVEALRQAVRQATHDLAGPIGVLRLELFTFMKLIGDFQAGSTDPNARELAGTLIEMHHNLEEATDEATEIIKLMKRGARRP